MLFYSPYSCVCKICSTENIASSYGRLELTERRREVKPPAAQGGGGQAGVTSGTPEAHPCRAVAEKGSMGPQGRKKAAEISLHLLPGEQNGNLGVWERK